MTVTATSTVRDLALEIPAATRVFEKLGIDYCCGGKRSLEEACLAGNLEIENVLESLAKAQSEASGREVRTVATGGALADLIAHIYSTHHTYTREEIARLGPLFEKVCSVHGEKHPELLDVREKFRLLAQELSVHMMKEEMILFPYIERIEEAKIEGTPVLPAPFGTVKNPVAAMTHEHDSAGNLLRAIRKLTDNYQPPAN